MTNGYGSSGERGHELEVKPGEQIEKGEAIEGKPDQPRQEKEKKTPGE